MAQTETETETETENRAISITKFARIPPGRPLANKICQTGICKKLDRTYSTQLLGHAFTILLLDRSHLLLGQLLTHRGIVAEIGLSANDQARNARAVVVDFREPFLADVFERGG
jgi:hypothetical protein